MIPMSDESNVRIRSEEPPSTSGLYWLEKEDQDDPIPISVIRHHDYLAVGSTEVGVEYITGKWTGPLPTPRQIAGESVAEEIYRLRHDMYVEKRKNREAP
jgi:hypothetical protein